MTFSKFVGAASAMALFLSAPLAKAHDPDEDKGPRVEQSFDLSGFTEIAVEGVYDVHVQVGESFSIETSGKAKHMDNMEVSLDGDTLVLGTKRKRKNWNGNHSGIEAHISLPSLRAISLSGVGAVEVSDINADDFDVTLEGIGSLELSGRCETLEASLEGMGSLDARNLSCADVEVDVAGMGSAEVYASESVDADIDGMGSIDVHGDPKDVKKSKGMMSSVTIH